MSALPLDGEHAVALEVAERAVVGDDLEAVAQRLEAAAGAVAAVGALADQVGQQLARARRALSAATRHAHRLLVGARRPRTAARRAAPPRRRRRAAAAPTGARSASPAAVEAQPRDPALGGALARLEVGDPLAAAVGALDARDEARHHRLDGLEDPAAVLARLGQRVGEQVQDQLLVGLAGGVDAHVRQRRRGQQAAQQVERLGLDRAPVRRRRLAVAAAGTPRRPTR